MDEEWLKEMIERLIVAIPDREAAAGIVTELATMVYRRILAEEDDAGDAAEEARRAAWRERKRRQRERAGDVGTRLRYEILRRDGFACQLCGRRAPDVVLHVDHVRPRSQGGATEPENLRAACVECNLGKSDQP